LKENIISRKKGSERWIELIRLLENISQESLLDVIRGHLIVFEKKKKTSQ